MKSFFVTIVVTALFCALTSCTYRRPYQHVPQREATISPEEERVEELERTERTETGPWEEKIK